MGRKPKDPTTYKKEVIQGFDTEVGETGTYVYLNKNWRIKIGSLNFDIEQKGTRTKRDSGEEEEKWECLGHYGSLRQVMHSLVDRGLKDSVGSMIKMAEMYNELKGLLSTFPDLIFVVDSLKKVSKSSFDEIEDAPLIERGEDESEVAAPRKRGRKRAEKGWKVL